MAKFDGGPLGELLSTPLMLPAALAGALAALFLVLAIVAWRRTRASGTGLVVPLGVLVVGVLAVAAVIERMSASERAAAQRALIARAAHLAQAALAPGSALSCLDARAGEAVENACEKAVFADARSAAAAVAYMAARVDLLRDAAALAETTEAAVSARFAASRRAIELDRFGVAAHVLASRHGCTADNCDAFDILGDTSALKSNLKARVFDQYVARHTPAWQAPPVAAQLPAVSESPAAAASDTASAAPAPGHVPLSGKYDFPSAASIPPVSIMNAEPPLPKDAGTAAAADAAATAAQPTGSNAAAAPAPPPAPRPKPVQTEAQTQASPAPAR